MTKGVVIIQPKDWTPDDGSEGISETLYNTYAEAVTAYEETDKDANFVTLWQCDDRWFNRIQRKAPEVI